MKALIFIIWGFNSHFAFIIANIGNGHVPPILRARQTKNWGPLRMARDTEKIKRKKHSMVSQLLINSHNQSLNPLWIN